MPKSKRKTSVLLAAIFVLTLWLNVQATQTGDFNQDGKVNLTDISVFAHWWLDSNCNTPGCVADIDSNNGVNAVDFAYVAANWGAHEDTLVISEFVASNGSTAPIEQGELLDEDGDSSDWIEIYNPAGMLISLDGWRLTNGNNNWRFPAGITIDAGAFLIVFASGKDRAVPGARLHTDFELDADGEYLALIRPDGSIAHQYDPQYPRQVRDFSYGLSQYAETFVSPGKTISYDVPEPGDTADDWTRLNFDDSAWHTTTGSLGFNAAPAETGADVGTVQTPGSYSLNDGLYTVTTDGQDIGGNADSFYFIYRPLSGDGYLTARVKALSNADQWAKAGVMIRETLNPSSRCAAQLITSRNGAQFLRRVNPGGNAATSGGGRYAPPWWVRIERRGNQIIGYLSGDGITWSAYSSEMISMSPDAYIGLCVSSRSPGNPVTAQLEHVADATQTISEVKDKMLGINASLRTRIAFSADEPDFFTSMVLQMRHEDAFIAYINGVEVARANFTGQPQPTSTADADRDNGLSAEFTSFDVSSHLGILREGTNVLAIQGLNDNRDDENFVLIPQLSAAGPMSAPQYFTLPTPGTFNSSSTANVLADTKFSHDRGFYDSPFAVTIHCETEGATIRYTTDGTLPNPSYGKIYTSPIPINTTTCLRAMAYKPGWLSTDVDTHTYVFLDDVLDQPTRPTGFPSGCEMDPEIVSANSSTIMNDLKSLPTMSLVMKTDDLFGSSGIYTNWNSQGLSWERAGSIEMFYPDGTDGFQLNCGVRIYGGVGRREQKKSFRLLFKRTYGPGKLRYPMFDNGAVDEFNTIILRANFNDGYPFGQTASQYIRDEYCRRLQLGLGSVGAHGRFVHLYVNGIYWGLYNPVERPDAAFAASYLGGDKEDWDAYNSGEAIGESTDQSYAEFQAAAYSGLQTIEGMQRIQGNNPDGTPNPDYKDLLDMDSYIDYMFLNIFVGNTDWPGHNWYGALNRVNPDGFRFFAWDTEWVILLIVGYGNLDSYLNEDMSRVSGNLCSAYSALRYNPEFQRMFGDEVHRAFFNEGPLYIDADDPRWDPSRPERNKAAALYAELAAGIERAMICESARWGDVHGGSPRTIHHWRNMRNEILNTYMVQRPGIVLNQLRNINLYPNIDAPYFRVNGVRAYSAQVMPADELTPVVPAGVMYYTLNGIDPRMPNGTPAPGALVYTGPGGGGGGGGPQITLVPENADKRVLVPTGPVSDNWKTSPAFNDSTWLPCSGSPGGVGYERSSGYQPHITLDLQAEMYGENATCYMRIPFTVSPDDLADITGLTLRMKYDDGFVAYLNGGELDRRNFVGDPVWNSSASNSHPDAAAVQFEDIDVSSKLNFLQPGTNILAIHGLNLGTTSSDMLISAELVASTIGGVDPTDFKLTRSAHIATRSLQGDTWSALSRARFSVGPVADSLRITEIMYHPLDPADPNDPNDPNEEYIELTNIGSQTINLNLVQFTNGIDFTFGNVSLAPGQYALVVEDVNAFEARYGQGLPIAGRYLGKLANGGEQIELIDATGTVIHDFGYRDGWRRPTDAEGFSLTIIDPANPDPNSWDEKDGWRASVYAGGSPGADDNGILPLPGAIVINEVLAHSHDEASDWIELYNTTGSAINIGGWLLSDSRSNPAKYRIATGTVLQSGAYIVFSEQVNFGSNSVDPGKQQAFAISENGESVFLTSTIGGVITGYRATEDLGASETGVSLGRYYKPGTDNFNFIPLSYPTLGQPNAYPKVGPIVISEIMYNPDWPLASPYSNEQYEYVELTNITAVPITLYRFDKGQPWRFTDGIDFTFPEDHDQVTIPAGGRVIVAKNPAAFMWRYPAVRSNIVFGPFGGSLDDSGEKLELGLPGDIDNLGTRQYIRVDRIAYSDGKHPGGEPGDIDLWPTEPDGEGKSLTRKDLTLYGNDPTNWQAATPSPGQ